MNKKTATNSGMGLTSTLTLIFIILKLTNTISWSWLWVLSPLWISFLLCLVGFCIILIYGKIKKGHI